MWTQEVFRAIRARAGDDCILTSYSRSTVVRARLMLAGWYVGRGAATGEKNETTVAATRLEELRAPLGIDWLGRVRRSAAVERMGNGMTVEDMAVALAQCPQMRAG
jgi:hypothetical protein